MNGKLKNKLRNKKSSYKLLKVYKYVKGQKEDNKDHSVVTLVPVIHYTQVRRI